MDSPQLRTMFIRYILRAYLGLEISKNRLQRLEPKKGGVFFM
jgi:hypothetical protein